MLKGGGGVSPPSGREGDHACVVEGARANDKDLQSNFDANFQRLSAIGYPLSSIRYFPKYLSNHSVKASADGFPPISADRTF